jgi:hypothetical protein
MAGASRRSASAILLCLTACAPLARPMHTAGTCMPAQPRYAPFLPLGIPQLKAGQRAKGWWFALSEGTTGAASLGTWLYFTHRYGLPGVVPADEQDRARTLQRLEIGTGLAFFALYAWGAIDAIATAPPPCTPTP